MSLTLDVLGSFSWTRNGTHFDIDKDPLVTMKPGSGTLIINIITEGKAETYEGVYQCTARNERGAAISNNIVVRPSSKGALFPRHDLESIVTVCSVVILKTFRSTYLLKLWVKKLQFIMRLSIHRNNF